MSIEPKTKYLTHAEAAKAKAEGKEVQVQSAPGCWIAANWVAFDCKTNKFRIAPPAPRVAREGYVHCFQCDGSAYFTPNKEHARSDTIRVREVLPGEPTVKEAVRDALARAADIAENFDHYCANEIRVLRLELCGND